MKIAERDLGPGHPVFLQAELGVTHGGNLKRAFELVDACAYAGIDAAKFIITDPDKIMASRDVLFTYETAVPTDEVTMTTDGRFKDQRSYFGAGKATRPIYDLLKETQFTLEQWTQIRDRCHTKGLIFYATADHLDAVDLLEMLQVPAHKVCAWDIAYLPLIRAMAATRKPVLLDVGTATEAEVARAEDILRPTQHMWVHSPHPHGDRDWQMGRLRTVGFSSPGRESWCDFVALGLGACLLEKRLTIRRDEPTGHHHAVSLEPDEFKGWVEAIRKAEAALKEDLWGGSAEAWAERKKWDRDERGLRQ